MHQLMLNFMTFIRVSMPFFCHSSQNFIFDSHLRALYKKKHLRVNSSLWSSQDYTVKFYSYSEYLFMWKTFLSSPVLYTNIKYVSYVWTVLYLYVLTSSNISEIYMTAYFEHTPLWYIICFAHPLSQCILPFNLVTKANMSFC